MPRLKAAFQVNTHAIKDRGNRVVPDDGEQALRSAPTADHAFKASTHAQIPSTTTISRALPSLRVIPSMAGESPQTSDTYWIGKRLGPTRVLGAYAWRSLINPTSSCPNGSDFPVNT
ncbi:MAG: hypothetical protein IPP90_10565 [Gemmatimonadaceae bacterium]|nr:hypothetical protein [Gemmatimonadaceae bacterium]